jgi:hypothetical protein
VTGYPLAPVRGKEARQVDDVFHLADSSKCICSSIPFAYFSLLKNCELISGFDWARCNNVRGDVQLRCVSAVAEAAQRRRIDPQTLKLCSQFDVAHGRIRADAAVA